jgi:hypothetical protein
MNWDGDRVERVGLEVRCRGMVMVEGDREQSRRLNLAVMELHGMAVNVRRVCLSTSVVKGFTTVARVAFLRRRITLDSEQFAQKSRGVELAHPDTCSHSFTTTLAFP